jgi:hypothetical protein
MDSIFSSISSARKFIDPLVIIRAHSVAIPGKFFGDELSPAMMISLMLMTGLSCLRNMAILRPLVKVWASIEGRVKSGTGSGRGGDLRNLSWELKGMGCARNNKKSDKKSKRKHPLFGLILILS